jgi:hypothetical protein
MAAGEMEKAARLFERVADGFLHEDMLAGRQAGAGVVDLTARNLAMSTAMALHHQRQEDGTMQASSERVHERCVELLRLLEPQAVKQRLETLLEATAGRGDDVAFLDRWGYDAEQRAAIAAAIEQVAEAA